MWLVFVVLAMGLALLMLLIGVVALVVTAVGVLPWLLILIGIWLLVRAHRSASLATVAGAAAGPRRRTTSNAAPARPESPSPSPSDPEAEPRRELPIDVQVKIEQIRRKADVLLGYADRFPPFSQDLHIVRQTTADYLPRTIEAYLALMSDGDPLVATTATTAQRELRDQLQLLDSKLDDIARDLQQQDLDRLLANRRFLEERFRPRESEIRVEPARQETDVA